LAFDKVFVPKRDSAKWRQNLTFLSFQSLLIWGGAALRIRFIALTAKG